MINKMTLYRNAPALIEKSGDSPDVLRFLSGERLRLVPWVQVCPDDQQDGLRIFAYLNALTLIGDDKKDSGGGFEVFLFGNDSDWFLGLKYVRIIDKIASRSLLSLSQATTRNLVTIPMSSLFLSDFGSNCFFSSMSA
jgi:hypothetical protein